MKKIVSITLFLFMFVLIHAQDSLTKYLDAGWKETAKENAVYLQKTIKTGNDWFAAIYYSTGVPYMKGVFADDSLATPNGLITLYNEKGVIRRSAHYKAGKADGLEILYYGNGKKRTEGNYKMDELDGDWTGYYESGKISGKAHYTNGEQNSGNFFNEDGSDNKEIKIFYRPAEFPGGKGAIQRYMSQSLQYPPAAQKKMIQGQVIVEFIVRKDGSVGNIKIVKSVEPSLDKEAMRVIRAMPLWKPGINGGAYSDQYMKQPVTFRLVEG